MLVKYDPEIDLISVEFRPYPEPREWYGERLDERRHVMRERASGAVIAVELLFVSKGVNLEGLPEAERIREALAALYEPAAAARG